MRRLAISDIHGGYKALKEVLKKAKADYEKDKLIVIGDVCDGWPEVEECFDEIMKFKNLVYIIGNHDEWTRQYYNTGSEPICWYSQGGKATIDAFMDNMPIDILRLLNEAPAYYIEDNMLFVHGGYNPDIKETIEEQAKDKPYYDIESDLTWDRVLFMNMFYPREPWYKGDMKWCEVRLIDTGASYYGPLTLMDIDTEEYWQSAPVNTYYPGIKARGHYRD